MEVKTNHLYYNEKTNTLVFVHAVYERFDGVPHVKFSMLTGDYTQYKVSDSVASFLRDHKLTNSNE